jgi:hypothetical protein
MLSPTGEVEPISITVLDLNAADFDRQGQTMIPLGLNGNASPPAMRPWPPQQVLRRPGASWES